MNETAASSNARKGETAAQLINRLSLQCRGNPVIEDLAQINEVIEADCLASALRASKHPELEGIGTRIEFGGSSGTDLMDRAMGPLISPNDTVQRVALHDTTAPLDNRPDDRAEAAKNRSLPTADDIIALVDSSFHSDETVQALSVKNSENNGCTVGSMSTPEGASHQASRDNFLASPPLTRFAHEDNEACMAPAPPSPVQEISVADLLPTAPLDESAPGQLPPEAPLSTMTLSYCRCDFFDNGPAGGRAVTKSGRNRARYRVNLFLGPDRRNYERFKISFLTEARFFKRRVPVGHSLFYEKAWGRFDELRRAVRADSIPMAIEPVVAHLKDSNNHVVPRAAAILFQMENEPADLFLFLDGSVFEIRLDQKAKGSQKCAALKGLGYWKPEK